MNYLILIGSGIIIGLIVALPIGPVNLICIRRTLALGPMNGFVSGLGAALGDGVLAIIMAFGFTAVVEFIHGVSGILELAGGTLLIFFGVSTFFSDPLHGKRIEQLANGQVAVHSFLRAFASTFALTIINPATLFGFATLFATLGGLTASHARFGYAALVVLGVVSGSTLWWFTLTSVVGIFHAGIDAAVMKWINRVSGALVTLCGLGVLGHLLFVA
ncbi:MAG TPA: LysE family transporter [Rhizomicrobium sp.]|nr:LysE family transporter [Rhizomicrobium sp.]